MNQIKAIKIANKAIPNVVIEALLSFSQDNEHFIPVTKPWSLSKLSSEAHALIHSSYSY